MGRQESLIVITGPTGSGKTNLAFELAAQYPIEIISADSMQVYRYMDIATAKPSYAERIILPHHIIDVINPDQKFNAAVFVNMASRKIIEVKSRGKIPVVIGGTGLYIKALLFGLAQAPEQSYQLRKVLQSIIERHGIDYLQKMLHRLDPEIELLIKRKDTVRILRSLEIIFITGKRVSFIFSEHRFNNPVFDSRVACIMPDRKKLFCDIDKRTVRMFDVGLIDETRKLLEMGYKQNLPSMQTLAYKHIIKFLNNDIMLDEAIRLVQRDTRRYAKRQITWCKSKSENTFFSSVSDTYHQVTSWLNAYKRI